MQMVQERGHLTVTVVATDGIAANQNHVRIFRLEQSDQLSLAQSEGPSVNVGDQPDLERRDNRGGEGIVRYFNAVGLDEERIHHQRECGQRRYN